MTTSNTGQILKQIIGLIVALVITEKICEAAISYSTPETFMNEALTKLNELRAKHGVPPMALNISLSHAAEVYACKAALRQQAVGKVSSFHSWTWRVGETSWSSGDPGEPVAATVIQEWYDENKDFKWDKNQFQYETGHFTQLIWKDSNQFGIGICKSPDGKYTSVIARFLPNGNWAYTVSFHKNVFPAKE